MFKTSKVRFLLAVLLISFFPVLAQAHVGVGDTTGFAHGVTHPLFGLDHLVAMLAVGLWASQCGGKALWALPASFLVAMVLGGLAGTSHVDVPMLEGVIVLSVVAFGLLLSFQVRMPVVLASLLAGGFALFHGYAHGAEMPAMATGFLYGFGFLLATAALHAAGLAVGLAAQRVHQPRLIRAVGMASVLLGVLMLVR